MIQLLRAIFFHPKRRHDIGASRLGLFLSMIRQGICYIPFILLLPGRFGVEGIYLSQPAADLLTFLVCVLLIRPMKRMAYQRMSGQLPEEH